MLYSEITSGLRAFFQAHLQVNSVTVGSEWDLNALQDAQYPAALIDPRGGQRQGRIVEFSYRIVICDRVQSGDPDMATSAQNNAMAIADDLAAYAESDLASGVVDHRQSSYEVFSDRYDSQAAGIVYALYISTPNQVGECLSMTPNITNGGSYDGSLVSVQSTSEVQMQMVDGVISAFVNEGSLSYVKLATAQTMVVIPASEHGLEAVSSVQLYDAQGQAVLASVNVTQDLNVVCQFQIPFTGRVVLSV